MCGQGNRLNEKLQVIWSAISISMFTLNVCVSIAISKFFNPFNTKPIFSWKEKKKKKNWGEILQLL